MEFMPALSRPPAGGVRIKPAIYHDIFVRMKDRFYFSTNLLFALSRFVFFTSVHFRVVLSLDLIYFLFKNQTFISKTVVIIKANYDMVTES